MSNIFAVRPTSFARLESTIPLLAKSRSRSHEKVLAALFTFKSVLAVEDTSIADFNDCTRDIEDVLTYPAFTGITGRVENKDEIADFRVGGAKLLLNDNHGERTSHPSNELD